jgi:hypothetical protein
MDKQQKKIRAWVITVDMGYGHRRATHALRHIAYGEIINANTYRGLSKQDKETWLKGRKAYESISRFKHVPLIGDLVWKIFDSFQKIVSFYPKRDLSSPTIQLKGTMRAIKNKNWGEKLINFLKIKKDLPLITSFFIPAYMAEHFNYKGDIYCIICDADISRAWAPLKPTMSKIKYFAPTTRVVERLKLYGVNPNNTYLTGFPLPLENLGNRELNILKHDLGHRLINLDPKKRYINQYKKTIIKHLGQDNFSEKPTHPLTLMFAVGGAGAQRELGKNIVKSLKQKILNNEININLVAGVHNDVASYFKKVLRELGLYSKIGNNIKIILANTKQDYFLKFNKALRTTDILWTKPSELSFYCALGLPIIIAPPIGSQEYFNQEWLRKIGAGINQYNPKYCNEWLFDWIKSGWLAEAAMQGFLEAPNKGTFEIEKILEKNIK